MKYAARCLIILSCTATSLLGWEDEPEIVMEGMLKTSTRQCARRYPDGKEEKWEEKHTVLVPNEPIVLSLSLSIGTNQALTQQISLPFIQLNLNEEFESLLGKRVKLHGRCTRPFHFFDEIELLVSTALDVDWLQSHQIKTVFYEPQIAELTGTLYQKTYPGPPEYSSIEDGDRPESPLFLTLTEPVDVALAQPEEEPFNQPEQGVREIQIVFSNEDPPEELWSRGVIVKGTLFSAHTGHHRRRVLMMANSWEANATQSEKKRAPRDIPALDRKSRSAYELQ